MEHNMLSRLVIIFLPRSKRLLISWLQYPSAVILEPGKIKSATVSTVSPSISLEVMGPDTMILVFWMLSFKPTFSLSSFTFIKRLFSSSSLSAIRVVSSHIWGYWYFSWQSWSVGSFQMTRGARKMLRVYGWLNKSEPLYLEPWNRNQGSLMILNIKWRKWENESGITLLSSRICHSQRHMKVF